MASQAHGVVKAAQDQAGTARKSASYFIWTAVIIGLAIYAGLSFGFIRRLNGSLSATISRVRDAASQTSGVSENINEASEALADGAEQQASAIQDSSQALETLMRLAGQANDNAHQASVLARTARVAADGGAVELNEMGQAMEAIQTSSHEIAKIIKTIDEIAFQTNILALNAAVEAARAGSEGVGFAVVADEVRNLARRSADASRETANKIQGAIDRSNQGAELARKVRSRLDDVIQQIRRVDELVATAAESTQEQNHGIQQISKSVQQMDQITRNNTANAQTSSECAQELRQQAAALQAAIAELQQLAGESHVDTGLDLQKTVDHIPPINRSISHNGNVNGRSNQSNGQAKLLLRG
jgi:methyl-accepting chemotaxis protein